MNIWINSLESPWSSKSNPPTSCSLSKILENIWILVHQILSAATIAKTVMGSDVTLQNTVEYGVNSQEDRIWIDMFAVQLSQDNWITILHIKK